MQNRPTLAQAMFAPRAIALIGASGDPAKNTARAQQLLARHGYAGRVLPINPGRSEIFGLRAYPTLRDAPGPIDHAFIMIPAAAVPDAIGQCCERGVAVATIFSDGFAERGAEGRRRQDAILATARAGGLRLVGPNSIGLMNVVNGAAISVNAVLGAGPIRPGPLSLVSQSGGMIGALVSRALPRGLGFSKLVSVGNESDVSVGEFVDMLADDPGTGAILLFMETIRDAGRLGAAARRAHAAGKPVIVYMPARSDYGRQLAESHTGALVGHDESAEAFFRAHGMLRVEMLESLLELPQLVRGRRPLARGRVAVMTGTGGGAAGVVDRLGVYGVEVVPPSPRVIANLRARGIGISDALLTDTTMGGGDVYAPIIAELQASDHCDVVLPVIGSNAALDARVVQKRVIDVATGAKPIAVFIAPDADAAHALLLEAGIASFRTPETCADSVRALCAWRAPRETGPVDAQRVARAAATIAAAAPRLNEHEACAVFEALGIARAPCALLHGPDDPVEPAAYPVAVKLLSRDVAHKTEIGGVVLGVGSPAELRAAAADVLRRARAARPDAHIDGILVQSMQHGLIEAIVGIRRDPHVGPVIALGIGGTLAGIYRDVCVRLAPVSLDEAHDMIAAVRGFAAIRGYRGLPRGDCAALAAAVRALSLLALVEDPQVAEAEINPLIVKRAGEGVVAVDG
ncbi:MAG TPA: acetate--CoA ligase family protein, partial [Burkholderiales bacterium]|nr:acetate--CoA ligase family protein [Burkholderiales bacterium]